jgi:glycosyltransferase involved in cell wall biosynthesis
MEKQRVDLAILVHDLSATGVVRNAMRIAGHGAQNGLKVELWVVSDQGAFRSRLPAGVGLRRFGGPMRLPIRRLETLAAAFSLAKGIKNEHPRVLISAGNHFHLAAGLAYRWAGRPATTRLVARASNAPPSHGWPLLARLLAWVDALKYRNKHLIVAVSQELASLLERRLAIGTARIVTIVNGVDLAAIARQAATPLDDPWFSPGAPAVIVSAGRLSRQKNFELLIESFAILRREREARLVILGDGPAAKKRKLTALAERLGVSADVRLAGFTDNPMRYFARASLFALSSRWEGASNVLIEAMACGCPVVAVDCPTGVREQLAGGRMGPIVPQGDKEGLARAMARMLNAYLAIVGRA